MGAAVALYGAIWLYELGNYGVAIAAGGNASLQVTGVLPTGVAVVNGPLLKPAQVAICTGIVVVALIGVRRRRLPLTKSALVTIVGVYLASVQWEFLSQPLLNANGIGQLIFAGVASGAGIGVVIRYGDYLGLIEPRNP